MTITIPHGNLSDARRTFEQVANDNGLYNVASRNHRTDGTIHLRLRDSADPSPEQTYSLGDVEIQSGYHTPHTLVSMLSEDQQDVARVNGKPLAEWMETFEAAAAR